MSEQPSGGPPSTPSHDLVEYRCSNSTSDESWLDNFLLPQVLHTEISEEEWKAYGQLTGEPAPEYNQSRTATTVSVPLLPSVVHPRSDSHTSQELGRLFCHETVQTGGISFSTPSIPSMFVSDITASLLPPTSRKRKRDMAVDRSLPRFRCPIFQDEVNKGLPHTCNGGGGNTMSELRTHMTRGTKDRPPHFEFLKRCRICNKDIIDKFDHDGNHGPKCHDPHPMRKGEAADEQYRMFCAIVVPVLHTGVDALPGDDIGTHKNTPTEQVTAVIEQVPSANPLPDTSLSGLPQSQTWPFAATSINASSEPQLPLALQLRPWTSAEDKANEQSALRYTSHVDHVTKGYNHDPTYIQQVRSGAFLLTDPISDALHATPDAMAIADTSPWSGLNLRQNPNRSCLLDLVHRMSSRDEVSALGRSTYAGSDFSRIQERDTMPNTYSIWDPHYDTSANTAGQGYLERLHPIHSPMSMFGDRVLPTDEYERNTPSKTLYDHNSLDTSTPRLECSSVDHGSMDTLSCHECGCDAVFRGRHSKGNLGRHRRLKHGEGGPKSYVCCEPQCPRTFDRKDARLKHQRRHHPHLEPQSAAARYSTQVLEDDHTTQSSSVPSDQFFENSENTSIPVSTLCTTTYNTFS